MNVTIYLSKILIIQHVAPLLPLLQFSLALRHPRHRREITLPVFAPLGDVFRRLDLPHFGRQPCHVLRLVVVEDEFGMRRVRAAVDAARFVLVHVRL